MEPELIWQILGSLAHEMNNPLGAIQLHKDLISGAAHELYRDSDAPEWTDLKDSLENIAECTEKLIGSIATLRALGEASRDAKKETFEFGEVLAQAIRETKSKAAKLKVEIEAPELPAGVSLAIRGDRGQIRQVCEILIGKAVEAAAQSELRSVRIACALVNGACECVIEDSGPEIAPSDRERIFELRSQVKRVGRGMGIGLTVARTILKENGGDLNLLGSGLSFTRFAFVLPVNGGAR